MGTIEIVREKIKADPTVRFTAQDMEAVLDEVFGTGADGIVMKFSEVERLVRTRELEDPVEIMGALQKALCDVSGIGATHIEMVPVGEAHPGEGYRKHEMVRLITSGMTRVGGKYYRVAEKDLMAMSLDALHEVWRFIRDAEEEGRMNVSRARREPWRR